MIVLEWWKWEWLTVFYYSLKSKSPFVANFLFLSCDFHVREEIVFVFLWFVWCWGEVNVERVIHEVSWHERSWARGCRLINKKNERRLLIYTLEHSKYIYLLHKCDTSDWVRRRASVGAEGESDIWKRAENIACSHKWYILSIKYKKKGTHFTLNYAFNIYIFHIYSFCVIEEKEKCFSEYRCIFVCLPNRFPPKKKTSSKRFSSTSTTSQRGKGYRREKLKINRYNFYNLFREKNRFHWMNL